MIRRHVLVMAKAPVPGRVKTRLCPPLSPEEAAALATAALVDTLQAVLGSAAERRLLALDGEPGPWLPAGFEVFAQRGRGLGERLGAAWEDAGGPGLQIGMDTPQVTTGLLDRALAAIGAPEDRRAVVGLAADGGWWAIGLGRPDPEVFRGVAMSTSVTGADQLDRLRALDYQIVLLPEQRDVDHIEDARAVADEMSPESAFARAVRATEGARA